MSGRARRAAGLACLRTVAKAMEANVGAGRKRDAVRTGQLCNAFRRDVGAGGNRVRHGREKQTRHSKELELQRKLQRGQDQDGSESRKIVDSFLSAK